MGMMTSMGRVLEDEPSAEFSSFIDILRYRARHEPQGCPFSFLGGSNQQQTTLTYAELDRGARAVAAWLQRAGLTGERVLLLYPPGFDFIVSLFGCLYAGAIAVPAYPPNPVQITRTVPRLLAIIDDAKPAIALCPREFAETMGTLSATWKQIGEVRWLQLPDLALEPAEDWKPAEMCPPDLALLQYTSGSTAAPKGVMITHSNLVHNCMEIQQRLNVSRETSAVLWLPPFHDMGLIGGLFQPVYTGATVHLMSPLAFLQRPIRWLQAISTLRAPISGGPNFGYELCVRRIGADEKKTLDLSCWKTAFSGAEPVQWRTLQRFADAFRDCGFRPEAFTACYGLAEATLMVSGGDQAGLPRVLSLNRTELEAHRVVQSDTGEAPDLSTVVSCGPVGENVVIVSPESSTGCHQNQVGEIWVSGASVAAGYWKRPGETQHTFNAFRADTGEGPFLRTGDLGFKEDGELFVTGRLKDLIIIAGRNHYPGDIEITVEQSHSSIRKGCSAAFTILVDEEERLVVTAELDRRSTAHAELDHSEVKRAIRRAVAETHDLQVHVLAFVRSGGVPKTSSGKIQRRACREAFVRGELDLIGS